ncbi:MAG: TonB C-terminal domain-containing protein [Sulfurimonas sp.]
MDNNRYFILSGFLSLSLFAFFLSLFVYMLFVNASSKTYGLEKKNYVSVSIVMPQTHKKFTQKKSAPQKVSSSTQAVQDIDVNDLFSDVWTPKAKEVTKRKVNSKRLKDIAKKVKTLKKEQKSSLSQKIQNLDSDDNKEALSSSAADEVNEYLAKIQAIVYEHFHVPPNTEGESVETVIELDPLGKMKDFRILRYSQSEALNAEADRIKERLKNVIFPKNPQNRSSRTKVVLISKE